MHVWKIALVCSWLHSRCLKAEHFQVQCMQARNFVELFSVNTGALQGHPLQERLALLSVQFTECRHEPTSGCARHCRPTPSTKHVPCGDAVAQGKLVSCVQCRYVPHAHHMKQTFLGLIRSDSALHVHQNHNADSPALVLSPTLFLGPENGPSHTVFCGLYV